MRLAVYTRVRELEVSRYVAKYDTTICAFAIEKYMYI